MGRKIAIALSGQAGDICTALSVLKFKDELWGPDAEITWLADDRYYDLFAHNPYLKVKQFPHGWQIPEIDLVTKYVDRIAKDKAEGKPVWEDISLAKTADGKVIQEVKHAFESLKDFDEVYFPGPWQCPPGRRMAETYPNCSKKVFGVPDHYEWHPVLYYSPAERLAAADFIGKLPQSKKIIIIETYGGSGQSKITHEMITSAMYVCEERWGSCNFIFVSHKYLRDCEQFPEQFFSNPVVSKNHSFRTSAAHFTVRQCGLLANYCDLFLSVSSGISCASSAWNTLEYPMLQYCGSAVCGTKELAIGECVQVFTDDNPNSEIQYFQALNELLTRYK